MIQIMRKYALLLSLIVSFQPLCAMVRAGVEVDNDDGYYYDDNDWDGPGFYYGIWFGNDYDYYNWRRGGYYYRDGYYHGRGRGYYDHGHGHGGGHHGGGGHH